MKFALSISWKALYINALSASSTGNVLNGYIYGFSASLNRSDFEGTYGIKCLL